MQYEQSDSGDGGHSKRLRQDKSVEECYRDGTLNRVCLAAWRFSVGSYLIDYSVRLGK